MNEPEPLYVVSVCETLNCALTGRQPRRYQSPPQPRDTACALVELLTSRACEGHGPWRAPVAGGVRTVALLTVDELAVAA